MATLQFDSGKSVQYIIDADGSRVGQFRAETDTAKALTPHPRAYVDGEWQKSVTDDQLRKTIIMGGAALVSPELIDGAAEVFGATVLNLFGQTELAPVLSMTRPGDTRADRLATVGRPLPQVECKIVDPASGSVASTS